MGLVDNFGTREQNALGFPHIHHCWYFCLPVWRSEKEKRLDHHWESMDFSLFFSLLLASASASSTWWSSIQWIRGLPFKLISYAEDEVSWVSPDATLLVSLFTCEMRVRVSFLHRMIPKDDTMRLSYVLDSHDYICPTIVPVEIRRQCWSYQRTAIAS